MELPGILNLALEGIAGVFERGDFSRCSSDEEAKEKWRFECDQVAQFLSDACDLEVDKRSRSSDIFQSYSTWAKEMGIKRTLSHNGLTIRLQKFGIVLTRGGQGQRMLNGLALKNGG